METRETKMCRDCSEERSLEEFHRDRSRPDGRRVICRECATARVRAWQSTEEGQAKRKAWSSSESGRASNRRSNQKAYWKDVGESRRRQNAKRQADPDRYREYGRRARLKDPEKYRARQVLRLARLRGDVKRPSNCSRCGKRCVPHGHHPDYEKPLEVMWVCARCHRAVHDETPS